MKILVTGGAGFIGSNYVRNLLAGSYSEVDLDELVVLDKFTYAGNRDNLSPAAADERLRIVAGDICDSLVVEREMSGVDLVVHFAAESHVDRSITGPAEFVNTNVAGTRTLLQGAREAGVGKFIHVSTDEVYGSISQGSWAEDHVLEPNSPYAASKAGSDLIARSFCATYGMDISITRCSNNYGPYQHPEKAIPLFITNLLQNRKVPLYGDGLNVREWLHVDDHCRAIQFVAERGQPGEIYNIGGGEELTNRELVARLLALLDRDSDHIETVADRKGHDRRYSLDSSKAAAELGFEATIDFDAGLERTVAWYMNNRDWWEPLKQAGPVSA